MGIHIICPPGHYGGVISGRLDSKIGILPEEIAIYQKTTAGWSVRALGITAARLWSCDLGQDKKGGGPVNSWMAAVVSKGFDPYREPRSGDRIFQVTQAAPSSLSAQFIPRAHHKHVLKGVVSPVQPDLLDCLFSYMWQPPGWDCISIDPIDYFTQWWSSRAPDAVQHAVLQVPADKCNHFNAAAGSTLGILPTQYVHATVFTAPIDIVILPVPGDKLTGLVTGLRCAYDHMRELGPDGPHDSERLQVAAWRIEPAGTVTPIAPVLCWPSGYWMFEELPAQVHQAEELVVAVTTQQFAAAPDTIPEAGGEVIAVRKFPRESRISSADVPVTQP
jgi:hypothetical protein